MNAFDVFERARAALLSEPQICCGECCCSPCKCIECNNCGELIAPEDSYPIDEEIYCGIYGTVRVCGGCL